MSRSIAIIPARGGSKGIKGKNLRELAGKPLIAWSILAARAAERIDQVVVSTDDEAIAEAARAYGADVPFLRPASLATDAAPTEPVMAHALDWYEAAGQKFDNIVLLQPTSPLRREGTIDAALARFEAEAGDSLLGVCETHHFFWTRREGGGAEARYDYRNRPRRQDIAPADRRYRETGSIYISRANAFRESGNRLSGKIIMFEMAEEESWELDSEADFRILEALFAWSGAC